MNRIFNIFVNKIVNILIIAILILIAFFIGLNTANAATVSSWVDSYDNGPRDETPTMESITFLKTYEYSDYNSDSIKELIFELSNDHFFDSQLTIQEFYSNYTYVVRSYNSSTIRVYVQDYNVMLDYQGLNFIEGSEIKFFFYNSAYFYKYSSYLYYGNNFGIYYNWYIDINYNTLSYTFSSSNRLIPEFETLCKKTGTDYISRTNTAPLFDSYNGNFAWIEQWSTSDMPTPFELSGESYPSIASIGPYYYYNIFDIPELEFVSSGVPEEEDPESGGGGSSSDIGDKIDDTNDKLDGIKGVIDGIYDLVGEITTEVKNKVSEGINGAKDILQSIYDFLTGAFTGYDSIEDFFESITFEDNGGISRIVSAPLDLIRSLINNDSCSPLLLPIWGKDIEIPSGCILWENATEEINTLWHTLICGAGGYFILTSLFKDIEKIKNPKSSEVSTLDL